jgi:hypothetical protein
MSLLYSELLLDFDWGEDKVIIDNDINLLEGTDFDSSGYKIFDINNINEILHRILINEIYSLTNKRIHLTNYHNEITEDEHKQILNSMPYKKGMNPELSEFSSYLENYISEIVKQPVKIFNDDIWFRICRPSRVSNEDFNPCHRDIFRFLQKYVEYILTCSWVQ